MKRFILFCALWILALCFMLAGAWAQTQEVTRYTSVPPPTQQTTEYRQPGDGTIKMANDLKVVTVPAISLDDKIQKWTDAIQNILIGAGTILTALLAIWAKIKTTQASVVPVLVKTIATHGTDGLKDAIEQASLRAGVEPALNAIVKANIVKPPENPFPPATAAVLSPLGVEWPPKPPVAPATPPNEIKPI